MPRGRRRAALRSRAQVAIRRSSALFDVCAEPVQPALPHAPVTVDPACRVFQLRWAETALARAANLLGDDEVDGLEDADVLLEAIERQAERLGAPPARRPSTPQPAQTPAA